MAATAADCLRELQFGYSDMVPTPLGIWEQTLIKLNSLHKPPYDLVYQP